MTLESKLKEISERVEKATAGPWSIDKPGFVRTDGQDSEFRRYRILDSGDTHFIAHARQDVPMLLEIVEFLIVSIAELDPKPPGILEVIEPYLENILEKHYGK